MTKIDNRIAILIKQKQSIFHTSDLGVLWNIKNKNTLYTLLKRYHQAKVLYRIFKGMYSLYKPEELDPFLLGTKALHRFAYISTESVLAQAGIISQLIYDITLISSLSAKFTINNYSFVSRKLKEEYLFNPIGIREKDGFRIADTQRAMADLLYFNPKATVDGKRMIDMKKLKNIQQEIGYPLTPHFYTTSPRNTGRSRINNNFEIFKAKQYILKAIHNPKGLAEIAIHFRSNSSNMLVERNQLINCDRGIGFGLDGDVAGTFGGIIRNNTIYHNADEL